MENFEDFSHFSLGCGLDFQPVKLDDDFINYTPKGSFFAGYIKLFYLSRSILN